MKAISLFACGGIGDLGLRHAGFEVIVANELLEDRAEVFKYNYPETHMVVGDIWEKKTIILNEVERCLPNAKVDVVFATPPCQGMSKNGRGKLLNLMRQGIKSVIDPRNLLVIPTVEVFLRSGAHTLVMENVPEMELTLIPDPKRDNGYITVIEFIKRELGHDFCSDIRVVEFADYGVPQSRQRLISIFTKNEKLKYFYEKSRSLLPKTTHSKLGGTKRRWVSVRDSIASLPPLDAAKKSSAVCASTPYHRVPLLDADKYLWVRHTPEEKSAFDNQCINPECLYSANPTHGSSKDINGINRANTTTPIYCVKCGSLLPRPWVREKSGEYRLMKGYTSAYKRMSWNAPASTLTQNLSYACSDNKLHPSQHRVLSLYEAMILHTITQYAFEWKRADGKKVSDKLIRELIGESIPPAGLEVIFSHIAAILRETLETSDSVTLMEQGELALV